jgi:hypothetical protein
MKWSMRPILWFLFKGTQTVQFLHLKNLLRRNSKVLFLLQSFYYQENLFCGNAEFLEISAVFSLDADLKSEKFWKMLGFC